ncbi:uncharacterized protein BP01DRAFT_356690 [Aspergillus saccharolyticus JOP 1030-1]|uniref:Uncharacterized protein n=1 Tax=Aspergillus saccharolyticus JOP 1030-1 TaxID=1450539 RepID=A0A318ZCM8_9EURO|nr:hypothetical protein BP01DRAFT_356690 [Aspergillus saccharolyticus JOP 1030-1]PYH45216.1 hypothetical protein BP01DRAFT_356690 [Aspergillus saccharolyticus JOP 1030-1]
MSLKVPLSHFAVLPLFVCPARRIAGLKHVDRLANHRHAAQGLFTCPARCEHRTKLMRTKYTFKNHTISLSIG